MTKNNGFLGLIVSIISTKIISKNAQIMGLALFSLCLFGWPNLSKAQTKPANKITKSDAQIRTDSEWKKLLDPQTYYITQQKGTERPFTGKYWDFFGKGTYICVRCEALLFYSETKFESDCGWPSFSGATNFVGYKIDKSAGMSRTEIYCTRCLSHLGHVFDDGPAPTHQRYCLNSASLKFVPKPNN